MFSHQVIRTMGRSMGRILPLLVIAMGQAAWAQNDVPRTDVVMVSPFPVRELVQGQGGRTIDIRGDSIAIVKRAGQYTFKISMEMAREQPGRFEVRRRQDGGCDLRMFVNDRSSELQDIHGALDFVIPRTGLNLENGTVQFPDALVSISGMAQIANGSAIIEEVVKQSAAVLFQGVGTAMLFEDLASQCS